MDPQYNDDGETRAIDSATGSECPSHISHETGGESQSHHHEDDTRRSEAPSASAVALQDASLRGNGENHVSGGSRRQESTMVPHAEDQPRPAPTTTPPPVLQGQPNAASSGQDRIPPPIHHNSAGIDGRQPPNDDRLLLQKEGLPHYKDQAQPAGFEAHGGGAVARAVPDQLPWFKDQVQLAGFEAHGASDIPDRLPRFKDQAQLAGFEAHGIGVGARDGPDRTPQFQDQRQLAGFGAHGANTSPDRLPRFKDQAQTAAFEAHGGGDEEDHGDEGGGAGGGDEATTSIPWAESVYPLSESVALHDNKNYRLPTLPAAPLQMPLPPADNDDNALPSTETPPATLAGVGDTQQIALRKHKIWAGAFIVVVVVIAVVVAVITIRPAAATDPVESPNTEPQTEDIKLLASDGAADDEFGWSVAISGDTLVIGAWADDDNDDNSGSAYVYTRIDTGTVFTEQAKLTASDGAAYDTFGRSVAINGETIVIGAAYDDTENGSDRGSAYVYTRSGTAWTQQAKLTASDGAEDDQFGTSVAINGDTIVIGANEWEKANGSGGRAYVYTRSSSGADWTEQAKLTASDAAAADRFGYSVAIHGDTLVIGAIWDDDNGNLSGSAYVYSLSGSDWTEQAKLTASDGAYNDAFGWSVAMDGGTIVVGAPEYNKENDSGGSAFVYTKAGTIWTEQMKLSANDGAADDRFGNSVAVDGDTIVIGAEYGGRAYVYTRSSGTVWTDQTKLAASDGVKFDQFGYSVAIHEGTIVIGAVWDETENGAYSGSVYIFDE